VTRQSPYHWTFSIAIYEIPDQARDDVLFYSPHWSLHAARMGLGPACGRQGGLIQQLTYQTHREYGQHKPTDKALNNGQVTG